MKTKTTTKTTATRDYGPTAFVEGDLVRARDGVQTMAKGATYTVLEVITETTPFGTFVTYYLGNDEFKSFSVRNGHMLLELAR